MRCRRPDAQKWEDDNERPFFASGADRACADPVWRVSLAAETAIAESKTAAVVTQDMSALFQAIDIAILEKRAEEHRFPKCLVKLAIAQYTGERWFYTNGPTNSAQPRHCPRV